MTKKKRIKTLIAKLENFDYYDYHNTSKEYLVLCCGWKAKYKRGPSGQLGPIEGPDGESSLHCGCPTYDLYLALDNLPDMALYCLIKLRHAVFPNISSRYQFELKPHPEKCYVGVAEYPAAAVCIANLQRVLAE